MMTGAGSPGAAFAALPLGLLIAAFLWVNEFPDYSADRGAGKFKAPTALSHKIAQS